LKRYYPTTTLPSGSLQSLGSIVRQLVILISGYGIRKKVLNIISFTLVGTIPDSVKQ
jgi:hypothetical protein